MAADLEAVSSRSDPVLARTDKPTTTAAMIAAAAPPSQRVA